MAQHAAAEEDNEADMVGAKLRLTMVHAGHLLAAAEPVQVAAIAVAEHCQATVAEGRRMLGAPCDSVEGEAVVAGTLVDYAGMVIVRHETDLLAATVDP